MNWIWLNKNIYPEFQKNYVNVNETPEEERRKYNYCVAEFKKTFSFGKKIKSIKARVSADSFYHFYLNGEMKSIGPASSGGDFLCRRPAPKHYANLFEVECNSDTADILIKVKLLPEVLTEYSRRHGGLAAELEFVFEDGTSEKEETDETWLCRPDTAYTDFARLDSSLEEKPWENAEGTDDIWNAEDSMIPVLSLNKVFETGITVKPDEEIEKIFELSMIYGVYLNVKVDGKCAIKAFTCELEGQPEMYEKLCFGKAGEYFSFRQYSCGTLKLKIKSFDKNDVNIHFELTAPWYPVNREGEFRTSDEGLNKIYEVCKHTLKICRQSIHLDSTKHQEHLACTGDYYIETLMTLYAFDDFRLSEFDLIRTADWIVDNKGRMFHTTYSLIWVQMLKDVYMITGNIEVLRRCEKALDVLFERFNTYIGDSGVIETPPDFMFVDWTVIDGYSMHHPPKALGQTVLNAFYYEALNRAAEIYSFLDENEKSAVCRNKAARFIKDFNREFFDESRGLYFDGKSDEYGGNDVHLPANSNRRYFSKYPNILACAYGLCDDDTAREIIGKIIFNDEMQDIQPYFMHYMLKAVRRLGLFGEYGMKLVDRWRPVVEECDKGLAEGWIAPEPTYSFDHSHAWGGTVAYNLPSVITGLKILEPGMQKISFEPNLWGLDSAFVKIAAPQGDITVKLEEGAEPVITVPDGIELV